MMNKIDGRRTRIGCTMSKEQDLEGIIKERARCRLAAHSSGMFETPYLIESGSVANSLQNFSASQSKKNSAAAKKIQPLSKFGFRKI